MALGATVTGIGASGKPTLSYAKTGQYVDAAGRVLNQGSGALGGGITCPPGQHNEGGRCVADAAPATGGGGAGFSMPSLPTGGAAWSPSNIERPNLPPINPQAEYDPQIANELASRRAYTHDIETGTGFAQDVLTGQQRDTMESQMREAEQAAAAAGIPFDRQAFLMKAQQGQAAGQAQLTLEREKMKGESLAQSAGVAGGQASERDVRLGQDLTRQTEQNQEKLDLYGKDIQKYGVDAQAATAANSALMDFYSRLMSGTFSAIGNAGGGSFASTYNFG